jgi:hypothetical protein
MPDKRTVLLDTDGLSRNDRQLLDVILRAPFMFWTCPVCVRPEVRWVNNSRAFCVGCGRKSTESFVEEMVLP